MSRPTVLCDQWNIVCQVMVNPAVFQVPVYDPYYVLFTLWFVRVRLRLGINLGFALSQG